MIAASPGASEVGGLQCFNFRGVTLVAAVMLNCGVTLAVAAQSSRR